MFKHIENVNFYSKSKKFSTQVDIPFHEDAIEFLDELSTIILKDRIAVKYTDILSLAFWMRKKISNN